MTKTEIAKKIGTQIAVTDKDIKYIIDCFLDEIVNAVNEGYSVEIRKFGTFTSKIRKARVAHNPKTLEKVMIDEYRKFHFKVSPELKKLP